MRSSARARSSVHVRRTIRSARLRVGVRTALAVLIGAVALLGFRLAPSQAAGTATLYVIQGLPDDVVSISVDGKVVEAKAKGTDVVGPFRLDGGQHMIKIGLPGGKTLNRTVKLRGGTSTDAVLHLPAKASGAPLITTYTNDLSAVAAGKATLTVAHTAAVPPADILVNGKVLFANVANGESLKLTVPADTYQVKIVPTGAKKPVFLGPVALKVKPGSLNAVYAVGDPSDKTMNVAVHTIGVAAAGSGTPSEVDTGTGGQAAGYRPSVYDRLLAPTG